VFFSEGGSFPIFKSGCLLQDIFPDMSWYYLL
jgi:hypothetical protein